MLVGPVFSRELVTAPRRPRLFVVRTLYPLGLLVIVCTAWLVMAGTQSIRTLGDLARFGALLFQMLAPLQLVLLSVLAAFAAASAVCQEKDRRTLLSLLLTRLSNSELVLGKLLASLLHVLAMLAAGLPVFMLTALLGGVSFAQIGRVFAVCAATVFMSGSLGATIAFWREKTFQTLSSTALFLVAWTGAWEVVASGWLGTTVWQLPCQAWAACFSPLRAVVAAAQPVLETAAVLGPLGHSVNAFMLFAVVASAAFCLVAVCNVRRWSQTPEMQLARGGGEPPAESIFAAAHGEAAPAANSPAEAETEKPSAAARRGQSRQVWDNPVLWREMCTWAYGRKVLFIRLVYLALFACAAAGLYFTIASGAALKRGDQLGVAIPPAARALVPFFLLSLVILNARATTSITSERDGGAIDLLMVTDLTPREFIFGKLVGVFAITLETVLAPLALAIFLYARGGLTLENLVYVAGGLLVLAFFVAMLGIHAGLHYASSRSAIGVSLGTVFFLFLGVATLLAIMVSFSGAFEVQLAPFLVFILGGWIGLWVALGMRLDSPAIGMASFLLPFATFYAVTSFLLGHTLGVFLVTCLAFGFASVAMLIPAIAEYNVAAARGDRAEE